MRQNTLLSLCVEINLGIPMGMMEDPPALVLAEILSRLTDTTDMARCRVVSKSLKTAS